jgi:hypothetical protein
MAVMAWRVSARRRCRCNLRWRAGEQGIAAAAQMDAAATAGAERNSGGRAGDTGAGICGSEYQMMEEGGKLY